MLVQRKVSCVHVYPACGGSCPRVESRFRATHCQFQALLIIGSRPMVVPYSRTSILSKILSPAHVTSSMELF